MATTPTAELDDSISGTEPLSSSEKEGINILLNGGAAVSPFPVWQTRPLTARQAQVLRFITEHKTTRGYPPTLREIGNHLGIRSTKLLSYRLRTMPCAYCSGVCSLRGRAPRRSLPRWSWSLGMFAKFCGLGAES